MELIWSMFVLYAFWPVGGSNFLWYKVTFSFGSFSGALFRVQANFIRCSLAFSQASKSAFCTCFSELKVFSLKPTPTGNLGVKLLIFISWWPNVLQPVKKESPDTLSSWGFLRYTILQDSLVQWHITCLELQVFKYYNQHICFSDFPVCKNFCCIPYGKTLWIGMTYNWSQFQKQETLWRFIVMNHWVRLYEMPYCTTD